MHLCVLATPSVPSTSTNIPILTDCCTTTVVVLQLFVVRIFLTNLVYTEIMIQGGKPFTTSAEHIFESRSKRTRISNDDILEQIRVAHLARTLSRTGAPTPAL